MNLADYIIRRCPETAIYIPNFITPDEEQSILRQVARTPKPKWTQLSHRRLINYGGVPHQNGMIAEELPSWLQSFVSKVNNLDIFECGPANHVLVNEYLTGEGIMPHVDGSLFQPVITTISCGSHGVLEFHQENNSNNCLPNNNAVRKLCFKLLIEPRSLLILKNSLYKDYLHSISEIEEDEITQSIFNLENCAKTYTNGDRIKRGTRLSLTIRNVPKTTKLKFNFFK